MPITTAITSNATLGLATASRALVFGVGTHQQVSPAPSAGKSKSRPSPTNLERSASGMRKIVSRETGNLRDRVRQDIADMLQEAGKPIQEQQGVMAAIATVSRWLGWSASKCRRHWYGEIQTVAAHDYLHAQQVLQEKRRRLEKAREDLDAALAEFHSICNDSD